MTSISSKITKSQRKKLCEISPVLNFWVNNPGELVIETTYGSKYFQQYFVGIRGGFCGMKVYHEYDFKAKKPYNFVFKEL